MSISLQTSKLKAASQKEHFRCGIDELDRPIKELPHVAFYCGWLPNDSWLSAARRVLKELRELEEQRKAIGH